MSELSLLVTGAGAPGIIGTIHSLRNNFDNRKVSVSGTDIREDVIGRHLCDSFYKVPNPKQEGEFLEKLFQIIEDKDIDIIVPQVTNELELLARNKSLFKKKGVEVLLSDYEATKVANNKFLLTKTAEKLDIPVPKFCLVSSLEGLKEIMPDFGYPEYPVVVKLPVSNGMRGLRIIWDSYNKFESFLYEKPNGIYCTLKEFESIFENRTFPELMVMEYLPNEEYTVDILAEKGNVHCIIPRKRLEVKSGITFKGITEKREDLIEYSKMLSSELKMDYVFGFQFKLNGNNVPKLLECNPRVQGTMAMSTFAGANIIYAAVKLALGEELPVFDVEWDVELIRYWGGIFVKGMHFMGDLHA